MKKLTPYLINKKALQFVMAALLLLGGSRMAWGQMTITWDSQNNWSGSNLGVGQSLIIEVDGTVEVTAMVQICNDISAGGTTVTIRPKNGTNCTIKRAANYTGIMFNVTPIPPYAGGILNIDPGVTFDGNGSNVTAASPMIVIQNNASCTANGSATNPVRFINTKGEVAIWNQFALICNYAEFDNNYHTSNGGAVRNYSTPGQQYAAAANFINCNFTNNTGMVGGAIFNTTGIACANCNFIGNTATNENMLGGGAIISDDNNSWTAQTTLNNCYFEGNKAFNGGAVLAWGLLDCDDCTFYDNTAYNSVNLAGPGGAIYYGGSQSASQSFTLDNCTFNSNTAQFRGGAILVYTNSTTYAKCIINHTDFYNNEAMQGGAIVAHSSGAEITLNSGQIYNNRATFVADNPSGSGQGAGVYVDNNSTFTMNGGEIGIAGTNGGNTAYYKGGGVYTAGTFEYKGGSIHYNEANDGGSRGDGGGVYIADGNFKLTSGTAITLNSATANGGGIYINGGTLTLDGTVGGSAANKNTAVNGGGVFVNGGTLNHNGEVSYNEATNGGGIYSNGGGTMNLNGGSFVSSNVGTYGAGVYVAGGYNNFMFVNSTVNNNTNATNGGGVYINGGMLQMQGGTIRNQSATLGGGVYVNTNGTLYQTAGNIGGSTSYANTATNKGGGVYSVGTSIFSGGTVSYNTVSNGGQGAGVYINGGETTQNGNHVIENNSGASQGAGVYINAGKFNMTADGGITTHYVRSHSATNGAGVYLNGGEFNLSGGYVGQSGKPNAATNGNGGGVYVAGGAFNMTGGNIIYNTASQDGAGVYLNTSTMDYKGAGAIEHNTATQNGGGVYVNNSATLNMENTKIQLNTAVNGGGVYVNAGGTFTMLGTGTNSTLSCDVVSNSVTTGNGGGVYHKGTTTVTGLIHINNNTGNRASNNAYLDQSGTVKYLYIGEPGLYCGSDIAIKNSTNNMEIARGTGSTTVAVKNAQYAYRNEFFRSDGTLEVSTTNTATPLYNYSSKNLYLKTAFGGNSIYALAQNAQAGRDYDGSVGNITAIYTVEGLAYFANDVNVNGNLYANKVVTLEADIAIPSTYDWEPIGYRVECDPKPFKGTFNGKFHTISGIHSNLGFLDAGLFGYVQNGTIKNVFIDASTGTLTAAENLGGMVGYLDNGTVFNCEARITLASGSGYVTGGLVGKIDNGGKVHSSCAMPTFSGSTGGGLVGQIVSGTLANCFVKTSTAAKALVANNGSAGTVTNCYANGMTVANLVSGTAATNCYASSGSASGTNGVFGTSDLTNAGKYGFAHKDQQITGSNSNVTNGAIDNNGELKGLLATLNKWVDGQSASSNYARWTRTMGADINGDYPVLMFTDAKCVGSKDGEFLDYATDLNPMIADYNNATNGGDIYLYAVPSTINVNTASNVRVYINEKVGVLQTTGNRVNARVGVTVDNSSTGFMAYDWHMFSSALTAANMGLEYHSGVNDSYYVKTNYSTLLANGIPTSVYDSPANMDPTKTTWSTTNAGYFPTNTPYGTWRGTTDSNGSFDFYCYGEPYAHWINFKREGVASFYDHWHMDADANGMHQNIPYLNEATMTPGKGYMVALSKPSMLMADGVLNNGDAAGNVSTAVTATNLPESESGLKGVNLIGNPYQSYLSFDLFAANSINADVNSTYYILDADHHGYVSYTVGQSDALAPRVLHPHQGFIVKVNSSRNLRFTPSMRATTGDNFREEGPHYALVNLFCADAQDRRDYTTVELDRPEVGGGEKVMGLHAGDASVWIHYDNADWQTAFTTPGLHEVPVRFKAYKDGFFTMGWETLNGYFSYMHLIDNMTGMDIDCLNAREYHFEGKTTDYTSRFRLVFEFTDVDENEATVEEKNFAFMMGDELVVNGNGMLQVFDLNGRCVYATELYDVQSTVSLPRMTAGVYILRLTGSQSARTQKMVIK